jgi:mono/diheme cytochrome c family protein
MRFIRGLVGLAPVLMFVAVQQFTAQTAAKKGTAPAQKAAPAQTPVQRGKYLVTLGGCNDCHTPKTSAGEPDMKRLLMGHPADEKLSAVPAGLLAPNKWGAVTNNNLTAWVGGWGVTFAPNLTPDKATGLGAWTPEIFMKALRTGKHRGDGRPILPPMPWPMYKDLTDADLRAMFAYLQSIPAINNMAPPPLSPDKIPR